jgi:L-aspartate oxidase
LYHGAITPTSEKHSEAIQADFLVVGAGVAGLRAAIELADAGSVLVVAKDSLRESSSEYAQGGIAVALSDDDEVELHEQDTLNAGAGLCDREAVRTLVEEGPDGIEKLIEWGAEFDREGTKLLFAREGAHSRNRVLHAHGDSTGSEIARTLYRKAASLPSIRFQSFSAITDLLTKDGAVTGAVACDKELKRQVRIHARAVLLATGGLGCVFKETTNPDVATGDGVATAYRAGAVISDIEFVQFHPTALFVPGAPRFLLSEALRGEGAYLRNAAGDRFMSQYHPMADLAPRDVVSRAIVSEMRRTGATNVFLDLTHLDPEFVRNRFPRVYSTCLQHGVDITAVPAPVHPAAHYSMGGVRTDLFGKTNLKYLYAAGEVACTGVHGANRLASNSLLEGVVFGARAGAAMRDSHSNCGSAGREASPEALFPNSTESEIRDLAWERCGIIRSGDGLRDACDSFATAKLQSIMNAAREHYELRNIHTVAHLIARSALAREESRGGHYRSDFTETRDAFQKHSLVSLGEEVSFD